MYERIWQAIGRHLDAGRMKADIAEFFALSRLCSYSRLLELAGLIGRKLEAAGAQDVRLIPFAADGRTFYGGWAMPRAYDVRDARLERLDSDGAAEVLADYHANPIDLMLYSTPTPPEGITAELVVADRPEEITRERAEGRFVLTSGIGVAYGLAAARAGAAGLVSDCRGGHRFFKNGPYLDTTNEWHNYTIPPWDYPGKGFGFSITPELGRRLRARLAAGERVRLRAFVDTHHYDGVLPVISALLPGEDPDEIALTGHYDEFGADDNGSQVAVAIQVVAAIAAMRRDGEIPPLQRAVRVLLPMEVRGFNALIQDPAETRRLRVGLNIDTVGTDQNAWTATCLLTDGFPALPSFAEELASELLERLQRDNPLFRWRRSGDETIDNVFGEPLIGAPTPALYHFSGLHHVALDTPEQISERMLTDMARVAGTYAAFLATAGLPEALWLADLAGERGKRRVMEIAADALRLPDRGEERTTQLQARLRAICDNGRRRIASSRWLAGGRAGFPSPQGYAAGHSTLVGETRLFPEEVFHARAGELTRRLEEAGNRADARIAERLAPPLGAESTPSPTTTPAATAPPPNATAGESVSRQVPVKAFRGFLAFEDLNDAEMQRLQEELKIGITWGAPMWLQNALFFANGKHTTAEIARLVRDHAGPALETEYLERVFAFLGEREQVRFRPFLTQEEIGEALRSAGLQAGELVLGHFSLSRFGYVEGGADALIDTVLAILGPSGTLLMPTFTCSWVGRPPFDPAQTPSRVGAVTDRFWRRPGVLRSRHPTHSFAALGPRASALLAGHDHTKSPLDDEGPISRVAREGGKILLFCPPTSNTAMHVGEHEAGLPLPGLLCPVMVDGERREVAVPECPWHVAFDTAWANLYARGRVTDVTLGEETVRVLLCRDAIEAHAAVARADPAALLPPGCECDYCRGIRAHTAAHPTV